MRQYKIIINGKKLACLAKDRNTAKNIFKVMGKMEEKRNVRFVIAKN